MTNQPPQLSEKDFINEGYSKNPLPLWTWFFILTTILALIWGGTNWYNGKLGSLVKDSPFLQVTNRQMSLFLWQNPEFMRINAKQKNGYLPAFRYLDKITLDLAEADELVAAPPELIFRYHTWDRLVKSEFTPRPIPKKEFVDFLSYAEEWHPRYWPAAPADYTKFVENLKESQVEDLATLPEKTLPLSVRIAFEGWQNYFKDGEAINKVQPTVAQMQDFLKTHPHYARNYWRNIVMESNPNYLKSLANQGNANIPSDELSAFLRVAFYNYLKAQNSSKPKQAEDSEYRIEFGKAGINNTDL